MRPVSKSRDRLPLRTGQTLTEYAAILVLVALVAVVALMAVSRSPRRMMSEMADSLGGGADPQVPGPGLSSADADP